MSNPLTAYQIYIGARNDAPNRTNTPAQVKRLHTILRSPNYRWKGYTVTEGDGYWTPDNGATSVWEKSFIITIFVDEKTQGDKLEGLSKELIHTLDQETVGVVNVGTAAIWERSRTPSGAPAPIGDINIEL